MPITNFEPVTICIPTTEEKGFESQVSEHFGRAPFHVMVDLETLETRALKKEGDCDHENHGHCMPVDLLLANGVDLVACKGIGRGALGRLMASDIDVFAAHAGTVGGVLEEFRKRREGELERPHVCDGHHRH